MADRPRWLWEWLEINRALPSACLRGVDAAIPLQALARASLLGEQLEKVRGRSVLLALREPLTAALALIELDGVARRMILCPPDLQREHMTAVIAAAEAEVCLTDHETVQENRENPSLTLEPLQVEGAAPRAGAVGRRYSHATQWILLSSGTTGVPKLIAHTLASLCAGLPEQSYVAIDIVWSTFYDIRRYGGLQILLRALRDGSLVLHGSKEPVGDFLARAAGAGVTHISGTPSHWRAALMSGAASSINPRYVRLSGEIADQAILDRLHTAYPHAELVHAFASTEAGLAFEVTDRRAGFPAALLTAASPGAAHAVAGVRLPRGVELKLDETLRIRSRGNAQGYLGPIGAPLHDADGFVDTGDRLELRDGRYHFIGRAGGIINVGGRKVHPEEVEAVINSHPGVRISRVRARRSPITGAIVVAEVVPMSAAAAESPAQAPAALAGTSGPPRESNANETLVREVLQLCRDRLAAHKVPAAIHIVERLEVSAAGKLVRADA